MTVTVGTLLAREGSLSGRPRSPGTRPRDDARALVLRDRRDLERALAGGRRPRPVPVVIALTDLDEDEARQIGRRLTGLLADCGCSTGTKAMVTAAAVSLVGLLVAVGGFSATFLALSPIVLAAALVGAGVGKVAGIGWARRRFRREITSLLATSAPRAREA